MEKFYKKKNEAFKQIILKEAKGASLEIAEYFLKNYYCYIDELSFDNKTPVINVVFKPLPLEYILENLENIAKKNPNMSKKIAKIEFREVKNMGFTIKDLKELIKDAPDDLPVEVIGRYVGEENMVMTDVGIDKESLWFELGYAFDRAGYLE